MSGLSTFPIAARRPAQHPDRLQLYSLPTPNGVKVSIMRPLERHVAESKRLLGVVETRLAGQQWIMDDDYSIADIASLGWVRNLIGFYGARELVGCDAFGNVSAWLDRGLRCNAGCRFQSGREGHRKLDASKLQVPYNGRPHSAIPE